MKKTAYHLITANIVCLSGLRIGGSDDLLQTGGTDLTCIKHPVTLQPYIPGSSLKGRLRSEMEHLDERIGNTPCGCANQNCLVCRVFGPHANTRHRLGPTRIIVRDAQFIVTDAQQNRITERKATTAIDRQTGTALHGSLRTEERVVAGSEFGFKLALQIWDIDDSCKFDDNAKKSYQGPDALIEFLREALRRVQRTGIGSGVSKGSGEIEFRNLKKDGTDFSL
jgi:CRISPR-associated protein Csm3